MPCPDADQVGMQELTIIEQGSTAVVRRRDVRWAAHDGGPIPPPQIDTGCRTASRSRNAQDGGNMV